MDSVENPPYNGGPLRDISQQQSNRKNKSQNATFGKGISELFLFLPTLSQFPLYHDCTSNPQTAFKLECDDGGMGGTEKRKEYIGMDFALNNP